MNPALPRLVTFCAHPVTGKTTISRFLQNELGFIRLGWDELEEAASWPEGVKCDEPGYDFRDGAWKQLEFFRDLYLARGIDVVVDSPATDIYSRDRIFKSEHPHDNYVIVLSVSLLSHRRFIRKRLGNGKQLGQALSYATRGEWDDPSRCDYSVLQSCKIIRYRNWWPWDMKIIQRSLIKRLGKKAGERV